MRVIDAHQHFWHAGEDQPWRTDQHQSIARDFSPDDLVGPAAEAGVAGTILVESVDQPTENDRLAELGQHHLVAGVVAWLPLSDPAAAYEEWTRIDIAALAGVRRLVGKDPLAWLAQPDVLALFRDLAAAGLAWDVVPVTPEQVRAVANLAAAIPELRIVIDHLGRPPLDGGDWSGWTDQMIMLSACPRVAIKVSVGLDVLTRWDRWDADALARPVEVVAEHFGADRCMLATNWPVVELRADYVRAWTDLRLAANLAFATDRERERVLGGTATEWYSLETRTHDGRT